VVGPASGLITLLWLAMALVPRPGFTQTLEPRSYSNAPVGLNFAIAGYAYSSGSVAFDPSVPLTDAHLTTNSGVAGFAHVFGAWSKAGKFDVIVPVVSMAGNAELDGARVTRSITGLGDPQFRVALNFHGAPALDAKQFRSYRQDLILGASLAVTAPWGQYDDQRLVNIGTNRWSFKPELGASKAVGPWILDLYGAVTFYTRNNDFMNGGYVALDPLFSTQAHVIRNFPRGVWVAANANYYWGARATVNDRRTDTLQGSSRFGLTLALPFNRRNSIKIYAARGVWARTHSNFTSGGIAWQYRWGAGI
jgi:hypothetical protein